MTRRYLYKPVDQPERQASLKEICNELGRNPDMVRRVLHKLLPGEVFTASMLPEPRPYYTPLKDDGAIIRLRSMAMRVPLGEIGGLVK